MRDALFNKNSVDLRNLATLVAKSYLSYAISSSNIPSDYCINDFFYFTSWQDISLSFATI